MNRKELIAATKAKLDPDTYGATVHQVDKTCQAFLDTIAEAVGKGEEVRLTGFGTFAVVKRKARTGRNPKTGVTIDIPEKTAVTFKASKGLLG